MKKQIFNRRDRLEMRRELRNHCTPSEALMWKLLKQRQILDLKFRRQFSAGAYILDFYCPSLKLCIELDGPIHDTLAVAEHDRIRTQYLTLELGIHVIRFRNEDVERNPEGVVNEIIRVIRRLTRPL